MKYLLDVNVLLAGIWTSHSQHPIASAWLQDKEVVLCPISELGFIRISSNLTTFKFSMADVRQGLEQFIRDFKADHIPADLHALASHPRTSNEVTDRYLADLAAKHGLKLATFDANLKHPSVELVS